MYYCRTMNEEDFIMVIRKHGPTAVRALAQVAREDNSASIRKQAIAQLVARRFLSVSNPTDDDLLRIENMTDDEITAILQGASH